jgi:hypothetical protein
MAENSNMRVMLQNSKSLLYFQNANRWTPDPDEARDFRQVHRASKFKKQHHLANMEIILTFRSG